MNQYRIELNILSYLILQDKSFLKKNLPVLRKINFSREASDIIKLMDEYVSSGSSGSIYDYVFAQTDVDYFNSFADENVSKKVYDKQLQQLIRFQEENKVRETIKNSNGKNITEVVAELKNLKPITPNKPYTLSEIRDSRLEDKLAEVNAPTTGYGDLDFLLKGFIPGHVYTMTGETNVGKTQIACNFAYRVALQNRRVLYFALEPDVTVIDYLSSVWSQKQFKDLTPEDYEPKVEIDVYTKDMVRGLNEMVQIVQDSERYDLIVIDHFGYFTVAQGTNKTTTESNAMKVLAQLAKRNKTAILSIVHPRKPAGGAKNGFMTMNDISGSAAFKQDSTEVLLIVREIKEGDQFKLEYEDTGHILVAKTKSGRPGAVPIYFKPYTALIQAVSEVQPNF
jgi:replicative DNA helicase